MFSQHNINCPVCKTKFEHKILKPEVYQETGYDTDFQPQIRLLFDSPGSKISPLYFLIATCPRCFFSWEFSKNLESLENVLEKEALFQKHKKALDSNEAVLIGLSNFLKQSLDSASAAIAKFLLAIYEQALLERPSLSEMARFYLRIGWIFRESEKNRTEDRSPGQSEFRDQTIEDNLQSLQKIHKDYTDKIFLVQDLLDKEFLKLKREDSDIGYQNTLEEMRLNLIPLQLGVQKLMSLKEDLSVNFQAQKDFLYVQGYLHLLKKSWEAVVTDEKEALKMSLNYYKKIYGILEAQKLEPQKLQISYLVGELSRRIGDFVQAREFFDISIENSVQFIQTHRGTEFYKIVLAQKILELANLQKRFCEK